MQWGISPIKRPRSVTYDHDVSSILSVVETLLSEPSAKAEFAASPEDFLASHGFDGLEPEHVTEALHHAADTFPPRLAAEFSPADGFEGVAQVNLAEIGLDGPGDFSGIDAGPPSAPLALFGGDVAFDFDHVAPATVNAPPTATDTSQADATAADHVDSPAQEPGLAVAEGADAAAASSTVDALEAFSTADADASGTTRFDLAGQFGGGDDPFDFDDPGANSQLPALSFEASATFDTGGQDPGLLHVAETDDLDDFGV